jgi:hypothetical protein
MPQEGTEFKHGTKVLVWQKDKPHQWACQVCVFWHVKDCEAHLAANGLPDCFTEHGYYVEKR